MIETDFGWALAKMRDGYQVRRKAWVAAEPEKTLRLLSDRSFMRETGHIVIALQAADVLAYDWELADAV